MTKFASHGYVACCNGVKYTMPYIDLRDAEAYIQMRKGDLKKNSKNKSASGDKSFGALQNWTVVSV